MKANNEQEKIHLEVMALLQMRYDGRLAKMEVITGSLILKLI